MEVRLLGPLTVVDDHRRTTPVRGPRQRLLLATLALAAPHPVSADRLAHVLWGDEPGPGWRNRLQAQVSQLRRALGVDAITNEAAGYSLTGATVDVTAFQRELDDAARADAAGDGVAADTHRARAIERWHGLADELRDAPELAHHAARLEAGWLDAQERAWAWRVANGRHADAVPVLEDLAARNPYRERLWATLVRALYACGRQADALRAYERVRRVLADELGLEPGAELRAAERAVLEQREPAPGRTGPVGVASSGAPRPLTRFVGREHDRAAVAAAFGRTRLVSLVGPGGVGKTRLAIELAHDRAGPVHLVPLAGVDADGVAGAITDAVVRHGDRREVDALDPMGTVVAALGDAAALVVLDNAEHLLAAVAQAAATLLSRCASVQVLTTSREPLGVGGEGIVTVAPLGTEAAQALFVDRARLANGTLDVSTPAAHAAVRRLCARLDGLPLALELAAARTRALSLTELLRQVEAGGSVLSQRRAELPHHRSLRATLDWSHELLSDDERAVFARLSVFPEPCTLAAAEAVCAGAGLAAHDVADALARLVDKSLVVADLADDPARYSMLSTVRDYARERLEGRGDGNGDAARARLCAWAVATVGGVRAGLLGPGGAEWRDRLEPDLGNLRAAFDAACALGDGQAALDLALRLAWLRFARAEFALASNWIRRALDVRGGPQSAREWLALARAAYFDSFVDDVDTGVAEGERAIDALRALGQERALADGLLLLGSQLASRSTTPGCALPLVDEAAAIAAAHEDRWTEAMASTLRASALRRLGRVDEAIDAAARAATSFEALDDTVGRLEALQTLARLAHQRGDTATLAAIVAQALTAAERIGADTYLVWFECYGAALALGDDDLDEAARLTALALERRGSVSAASHAHAVAAIVARRRRDAEAARRHAGEALRWSAASGSTERARALALSGWLALDDGDPAAAAAAFADAQATATERSDPRAAAWALEGRAAAALAADDAAAAAHLLGEADALRADAPAARLEERADVELVEAGCRRHLGTRFDALRRGAARTSARTRASAG